METNAVQDVMGNIQGMFNSTPEWIATAQELLTKFGLKIVAAILIFVIGRWVAKLLKNVLQKTLERAKVDHALVGFSCSLVHAGLMVFVILAALGQVGVQTTSFIAVLGAAGLAVGYWGDFNELRTNWGQDKAWQPHMDAETREKLYAGWKKSVTRTFDWVE